MPEEWMPNTLIEALSLSLSLSLSLLFFISINDIQSPSLSFLLMLAFSRRTPSSFRSDKFTAKFCKFGFELPKVETCGFVLLCTGHL